MPVPAICRKPWPIVVRTVGTRRVLVAHPRLERSQSLVGLLNHIGFEADAARDRQRGVSAGRRAVRTTNSC